MTISKDCRDPHLYVYGVMHNAQIRGATSIVDDFDAIGYCTSANGLALRSTKILPVLSDVFHFSSIAFASWGHDYTLHGNFIL